MGTALSEDLYLEHHLTSDLDSGVLEVTSTMALRASSPLSDKTEQDLHAAYNTFSPSAASAPLPSSHATGPSQDQLPLLLDKSHSCPSPSDDGGSLLSIDGYQNCPFPSATSSAMSYDALTRPYSVSATVSDKSRGRAFFFSSDSVRIWLLPLKRFFFRLFPKARFFKT